MPVKQEEGIPAAEVLSEFFRLAKNTDFDGDEISIEDMDVLRREERCYSSRNKTPDCKEMARSYHRRMLIGAGMAVHSKLPKDFILFSASLPAYQIAEMSCGVACESGRLLEIQEKLAAEDSQVSDEEIQALDEEGEGILEDIFGTVFCHILRAYGHAEIAGLYEDDAVAFQHSCNSGRLFVVPDEALAY